MSMSISGLVVEYVVAIDVTRVRFPADAFLVFLKIMSGVAGKTTATGFEPARAEPIGFQVQLLNLSDTLSGGS